MIRFHQWLEQVTPVTNPDLSSVMDEPVGVPTNPAPAGAGATAKPQKATTKQILEKYKIKPWKASKEEILSFWKSMAGGSPLAAKPIPYDHEGSTIQEDGVRITGSKEFISSVLSRLKDFIVYESDATKLSVAYRQSPRSFLPGNKNSYIFYLQIMERGKE